MPGGRGPGYRLAGLRYSLGDILRHAGRAGDAEPYYLAILDDPASTPYERMAAYRGLAWCALGRDDVEGAGRHARAAVRLAEPLGDDALCMALDVLVEACLGGGDLDAAWQAATRYREAAGRVGGHDRPYFAVWAALDVALDRGDLAAAGELLAELDRHATVLDADAGGNRFAQVVAQQRQRLDHLQARP